MVGRQDKGRLAQVPLFTGLMFGIFRLEADVHLTWGTGDTGYVRGMVKNDCGVIEVRDHMAKGGWVLF